MDECPLGQIKRAADTHGSVRLVAGQWCFGGYTRSLLDILARQG